MAASRTKWTAALILSALAVAGCEEGGPLANFPFPGKADTETAEGEAAAPAGRTVERDVEAPDVFGVTENGLWDGRPSLGGIWVAYPDVTAPERVMIRNTKTGAEVVGALFKREREMPGPKLQVSSEAAAELDMLAGQPTELSVVALRREEVVIEPEAPPIAEISTGEIEATPLDPAGTAAAAMEAVGAAADDRPEPRPARQAASAPAPAPAPAEAPAAAAPAPAAAPAANVAPSQPVSGGSFIQIGIFSVEENARNAGESLRVAGIIPSVREQKSGDKTYWRVLVGPVASANDRATLLEKVRDLGYADAYVINN